MSKKKAKKSQQQNDSKKKFTSILPPPPTNEHGYDMLPRPFDARPFPVARQRQLGAELSAQSSYLARMPFLSSDTLLDKFVDKMDGGRDFCWSLCWEADWIARLCKNGFLPMACQAFADLIILLPKLHNKRCCLFLTTQGRTSDSHNDIEKRPLKIGKKLLKRCKDSYIFTVSGAFNEVIEKCQKQHGENCWLYSPLTQSYREIFEGNRMHSDATDKFCGVRFYSFELWDVDDETGERKLIAGELGYALSSPRIYTSLSGFSSPGSHPSSGSIQLAATSIFLQEAGFDVWDFGMGMDYKYELNAVDVDRDDFVKLVRGTEGVVRGEGGASTTSLEEKESIDFVAGKILGDYLGVSRRKADDSDGKGKGNDGNGNGNGNGNGSVSGG